MDGIITLIEGHKKDLVVRMDEAAVLAESTDPVNHPRLWQNRVDDFKKLQARYMAICDWLKELQGF